jgi:hypothetical protein
MAEKRISAEQEIHTRHFCYFGTAAQCLLERLQIKEWREALEVSNHAELAVKEDPGLRFESWERGAWSRCAGHDLWHYEPGPYS